MNDLHNTRPKENGFLIHEAMVIANLLFNK